MTTTIILNRKDHPVGTTFLEKGLSGLKMERKIAAWSPMGTSLQLDYFHPTVWADPTSIQVAEVLTIGSGRV